MKFWFFFGFGVFLFLVGTFFGLGELILSVFMLGFALFILILSLGSGVPDGKTVVIIEFLGNAPEENDYLGGRTDRLFERLFSPRVVKGLYFSVYPLAHVRGNIDISPQTLEYRVPETELIDVDGGALGAKIRAVVKVLNPVSAFYNATETSDQAWKTDIQSAIGVSLRNAFIGSGQDLASLIQNGRNLNQDIISDLTQSADRLGLEIVQLDIVDISPSPEVLKAREAEFIAQQQQLVKIAEADGTAKAIQVLIAAGVSKDQAERTILTLQILNAAKGLDTNFNLISTDIMQALRGLLGGP